LKVKEAEPVEGSRLRQTFQVGKEKGVQSASGVKEASTQELKPPGVNGMKRKTCYRNSPKQTGKEEDLDPFQKGDWEGKKLEVRVEMVRPRTKRKDGKKAAHVNVKGRWGS